MRRKCCFVIVLLISLLSNKSLIAQEEDFPEPKPVIKKDSARTYRPKTAILRSALVPGLGQAYNRKYWKIPIIYGALGTTTYLFFRNLRQYRDSKDAYRLATDGIDDNNHLIKEPYFSVIDQPDRIRNFRNQVRQNMDYCVLWFILFWGLNVADAAVDAHLKSFDVSDDLSLQIRAGHSSMANTSGLSLIIPLGR